MVLGSSQTIVKLREINISVAQGRLTHALRRLLAKEDQAPQSTPPWVPRLRNSEYLPKNQDGYRQIVRLIFLNHDPHNSCRDWLKP